MAQKGGASMLHSLITLCCFHGDTTFDVDDVEVAAPSSGVHEVVLDLAAASR